MLSSIRRSARDSVAKAWSRNVSSSGVAGHTSLPPSQRVAVMTLSTQASRPAGVCDTERRPLPSFFSGRDDRALALVFQSGQRLGGRRLFSSSPRAYAAAGAPAGASVAGEDGEAPAGTFAKTLDTGADTASTADTAATEAVAAGADAVREAVVQAPVELGVCLRSTARRVCPPSQLTPPPPPPTISQPHNPTTPPQHSTIQPTWPCDFSTASTLVLASSGGLASHWARS